MSATSMSRMIVPIVPFVVVGGIALAFAIQHISREPSADTKAADTKAADTKAADTKAVAATTAPAAAKPAAGRDQAPAALAAAKADAKAVATALTGAPPPPDSNDGAPAFDIARIEPNGDTVIAGRAAPGATVELLRNGEVHDRVVADQSGQFAFVPPRLPPGTYDLTLRTRQPDGKQVTSRQSVAVAIESDRKDPPVVALMTPDKPTVVLSRPAAPNSAAGAVVVEAVELEPGGKLHVSGHARPGAAVRFYLNDSFLAPVTAGADGRFSVTINAGVTPGSYRVRLDEVEQTSGAVRARAEVPFNVPDKVVTASATASVPAQVTASKPAEAAAKPAPAAASEPEAAASKPAGTSVAEQPRQPAIAVASAQPEGPSSTVVVPKIATTTVSRGDSLWRISRLTYGAGVRYAVIYDANRDQIRDPDLIYPGQIFVLPTR